MRLPSTSRPKTVPAQCVPCPCRSPSPEPVKSFSTMSTPAKVLPVDSGVEDCHGHALACPIRSVCPDRGDAPCIARRRGLDIAQRANEVGRHQWRDGCNAGFAGELLHFLEIEGLHRHFWLGPIPSAWTASSSRMDFVAASNGPALQSQFLDSAWPGARFESTARLRRTMYSAICSSSVLRTQFVSDDPTSMTRQASVTGLTLSSPPTVTR